MDRARFREITGRYSSQRIAVVGDVCLDRYLEIDPAREEVSLETGLPVHNVVNVRGQPGGAGTIINNLSALGVKEIWPIAFAGIDGEGFELLQALRRVPGISTDYFLQTPLRRTFTYAKPLILHPGRPPQELSRLDHKNWTPTPRAVEEAMVRAIGEVSAKADAVIVLDQVDLPGTGVITPAILSALGEQIQSWPDRLILADSRNGFTGYPPMTLKMNLRELAAGCNRADDLTEGEARAALIEISRQTGRNVFVTLAEKGLMGGSSDLNIQKILSLPVRGTIDVVGAGDAVTANLTAALLGGATVREALELAAAGASVVIHQLGTTGVARVTDLEATLFQVP